MKKYLTKPVRIAICLVLGLALAMGGCILLRDLLDPMDRRIAENVTIGGLDVSGMTRPQARDALKTAEKQTIRKDPLTLQLPGKTLEIEAKAAGLRLKVGAAVRDAYKIGRQTMAEGAQLPLSDYLDYKKTHLRSLLEDYASKYDTTLTAPAWKLRGQVPDLATDAYDPSAPGQTVELTLGLPERHLDAEDAIAQILQGCDQALLGLQPIRVHVPCKTEPQQPNLEEIYATCAIAPRDDALDWEAYGILHGSFGYHFDMEKARELVDAADYGETVSIPMEAYEPETYGDDVYFQDTLGTCATKHTDDENRNTNLRLVCEALNGCIIQPGEEFSYNATVGERTPERGFLPANAFSGDRMTKDYGGGVCQGSTTLYNCLLLADMEVTERHGHGAMITYMKLGLDAAVNWGTKTDLRFVNNSHFPVKIQAELSEGYMKMALLGTEEKDYYIEMETNQVEEGGYIYAGSYKVKYDKETGERISREHVAFSSYDLAIG